MYCPNCGQQQISDEMRFCSRCGLALSGLAEWLASGGQPGVPGQGGLPRKGGPAATRADDSQDSAMSPRRRAIRRAAKLMFFSGVLFPVFLIWSLAIDEGVPLIIPFGLFFVGLVIMLYSLVFGDKTAPVITQSAQTRALGSTPMRGSLPPATNLPRPDVNRQRVRTNELAQPPSVTENTTKLLDNE